VVGVRLVSEPKFTGLKKKMCTGLRSVEACQTSTSTFRLVAT